MTVHFLKRRYSVFALRIPRRVLPSIVVAAGLVLTPLAARAQEGSIIRGHITRADAATPLQGVVITVVGTSIQAVSGADGRYQVSRVPAGRQVLEYRWIGYKPRAMEMNVTSEPRVLDVSMDPLPVSIGQVEVTGASLVPERVVDAPVAISVVDATHARDLAITGQTPKVMYGLPGVDATQNGINDFNINARGFNGALNRRLLVLQDGRDLAFAFLGSQEWGAMSMSLEDMGRIEVVRGPASALYGANAFGGVINIVTPVARDTRGTRLTVAGGELSTMNANLSQSGVFGNDKFGYRLTAGFYRSDSWSLSRTNLHDLKREYASAVDTSGADVGEPIPGFEVRPMNGQTKEGGAAGPARAIGTADPVQNRNAALRLDYYADRGSITTLEGGLAVVENDIFTTPIGRVQVTKAERPWARAAIAAKRYNIMAYYTGRRSAEPQYSLASGLRIEEVSSITHVEAQFNWPLWGDRGRLVAGASARNMAVDSKQTLLSAADDDRSDSYKAVFGQFEYKLVPSLRLVAAGRIDKGALYSTQYSPKLGLQFTPRPGHVFRAMFNRAFLTPNTLQYFLNVPAGAPANLSTLEAGLRASPLGPALAGVPNGTLFTTSAAVPVLGLGNPNLKVEQVRSYEVGYKGDLTDRLFVSIDAYDSRLTDFVTSLLPGANSAFSPWTSPEAVPASARASLEGAVRNALAGTAAAVGLTRMPDGSTAIVLSTGNAGRVKESGVEFAGGYRISNAFRVEANYTYFKADVDSISVVPGDRLLPNTPSNKGSFAAVYAGSQGLDARVGIRAVERHPWASGVYRGPVPASQMVDLSLAYRLGANTRLHLVATNLLDQQRYEAYGGSVNGRRVLGGITVTF